MENNKLQLFKNEELSLKVRAIQNEDGSISVNAEDTAIGFGWIQKETKNRKEYTTIKWARMNGFIEDLGFDHKCSKDDYIPESLFYMLGMKASNEVAKKFQQWLACDVIPDIRKHGMYATETTIDDMLGNPDFAIELLTKYKKEKEEKELLKKQNEENEPKVEGYKTFIDTENLLSWDTVAKNLNIGRNTMLKILRKMGILQEDTWEYKGKTCTGEHQNVPYQKYMKYFDVKYTIRNGKRFPKTLVRSNGQDYIRKKLKQYEEKVA